MNNKINVKSNFYILKTIFLLASIIILIIIFSALYHSKNNDLSTETTTSYSKNLKDYKLNIEYSILEGVGKDLLPYKIIANNIKKIEDSIYAISSINAKYQLENGTINIKAANGVIDDSKKLLSLVNDVTIDFKDINFLTEKIILNLNSNEVESDSSVQMIYRNSKIEANEFNTENSNNIINFKGNVRLVFNIKDFK